MKGKTKALLRGFGFSGLNLLLLLGGTPEARAASSYRATPQGIEVSAEMQSYNPAVLHITFGEQPDAEPGEDRWRIPEANESEPDAFFDPARLPDDTAADSPTTAHRPDAGARPGPPQSTSVPEPGTFALLGLGIAALLMRRRRQ